VKKEYFQLIVRQLLDPNFGMFTFDPESRVCWFNPNSFETESQFMLIVIVSQSFRVLRYSFGMLQIIGLAIYNGVILDISFPHVVYKKLLGFKPTLEDLKQSMPALGLSLQKLLDYDGNVEDDFDLVFQVSMDYFGATRSHDLISSGGDVTVTNNNRKRYVDLYVLYILEDSVSKQFDAFKRGFLFIAGGPVLRLLRYDELELLVCGEEEEPDFSDLEAGTKYEGGFSANHPVIKQFWEVVHGFTLAQKKKFLEFCTGSDRVPIGGLKSLNLILQRNGGDDERLPTASTCYNVLLLPGYASKEKLRAKLITAIENATGFGLK